MMMLVPRLALSVAAFALAAPALATPNARIVKTFMAEVPALGQFGTPQALCSASVLPVSGQAGTRGQVRGKQMVRVECPGFFTHERTDGLPPSGAGRPAPIPD